MLKAHYSSRPQQVTQTFTDFVSVLTGIILTSTKEIVFFLLYLSKQIWRRKNIKSDTLILSISKLSTIKNIKAIKAIKNILQQQDAAFLAVGQFWSG